MKTKKHPYSDSYKSKISMEAMRNHKTIGDLSLEYRVPANTILKWKKELLNSSPEVFRKSQDSRKKDPYMDKLKCKISRLEKEKSLYITNMKRFGV